MAQKFIRSWDEVPLYVDAVYVSRILGVTEETVRKYIRAGKLKSVCVGRQHRIAKEAIQEFLSELPTVIK